MTAVADDGIGECTTQDGSAADDRGAAITTDAAGRLLVVGHTNGNLGTGPIAGGTDVFALMLDPTGAIVERTQLGSAQRDGADGYDEANLFIAGGGSTWIQGVTFGSVSGVQNAGAGDVFLTTIPFDAVVTASVSAPADIAAVVPDGTAPPVPAPTVTIGSLVIASVDAARWAALSALLLLMGVTWVGYGLRRGNLRASWASSCVDRIESDSVRVIVLVNVYRRGGFPG